MEILKKSTLLRRVDSTDEEYTGLKKALSEGVDKVLDRIAASCIREGGEVSPADKWSYCRKAETGDRYVICNAFGKGENAGRELVRLDPHAVLEGLLIAAYASGAGKAYICINETDLQTKDVLMESIDSLHRLSYEGDAGCQVELFLAPDSLVCMEETALMSVIQGEKPITFIRPEYPCCDNGLFGMATCVHGPETLAYVSAVLQGMDVTRCSRLVVVRGDVVREGLAEIELGTPFSEIVEYAEGIAEGKQLKFMIYGGPAGSVLKPSMTGLKLEWDVPGTNGHFLNTGELRVYSMERCPVGTASEDLLYLKMESCGTCVFCREGSKHLHKITEDITNAKAAAEDIDLLSYVGEGIIDGALCAFGKGMARMMLSSLGAFREEYEAHIKRKRCAAVVCKGYVTYHILGSKCQGCGRCMEACSRNAILGEPGMIHVVDQFECNKCGECLKACPPEYEAIVKAGAIKPKTPKEPIRVGTWKGR